MTALCAILFSRPNDYSVEFRDTARQQECVTVSYVDLGSQHVIIYRGGSDMRKLDVEQLGISLRWHLEFALPVGANANFLEAREDGDEQYLRIRAF